MTADQGEAGPKPQAASPLDALQAQAAQLEMGDTGAAGSQSGQNGEAAGQAAEDATERNTRAIGFALAMLREATASPLLFDPPIRALAQHLPDEKINGVAGPWAKVATHYGVDLMHSIDHPAREALLLTGPALYALARALLLELRDRKPVQAMPEAAPA